MVEPQKYLFTLLSTKNIEKTAEFKLGYTMEDLLNFISENPSSSMYDCQKHLKGIGKKISYKNVEERLYKLIKLGLIQKVTNLDNKNMISIEENEQVIREKSKNSHIYYSITSAGIFYLFIRIPDIIKIKTILANKEDGLFVNFLYPILDFNTLEKIQHPRTIMHIIRFLGRCCEIIQSELESLRIVDRNGGESYILGQLMSLTNPEDDDVLYGHRVFIQGLKNISKIKWLDPDNTKTIEIEKDRLFKICDDKGNELILEINLGKKLAVLSDKNHKIKEFNLEADMTWDYYITYFNHTVLEDYIEQRFKDPNFYLYHIIDKYQKEFCNFMLEYIDTEYPIMNKEERMIKRQDCIAIAKDNNFQKIMSYFKQDFDSRYGSFIKFSNIQQV